MGDVFPGVRGGHPWTEHCVPRGTQREGGLRVCQRFDGACLDAAELLNACFECGVCILTALSENLPSSIVYVWCEVVHQGI